MTLFETLNQPDVHALIVAAFLGSLLGFEREVARKDPSLRTFMLISVGSCLFSLLSIHSTKGIQGADPSRIAAQIVVGIGFLGAGTIFRSSDRVVGLTTAALMWVTAAIGACVGFGHSALAICASLICLVFMTLLALFHRLFRHFFPE